MKKGSQTEGGGQELWPPIPIAHRAPSPLYKAGSKRNENRGGTQTSGEEGQVCNEHFPPPLTREKPGGDVRRKMGTIQPPTFQTRGAKKQGLSGGGRKESMARPPLPGTDARTCTEVRAQSSPGRATETWQPGATKTDCCHSPTLAAAGAPRMACCRRRTTARDKTAARGSLAVPVKKGAWLVSREPNNSLCPATRPRGSRNPSGQGCRAGRSGGCVDRPERAAVHSVAAVAGTASRRGNRARGPPRMMLCPVVQLQGKTHCSGQSCPPGSTLRRAANVTL